METKLQKAFAPFKKHLPSWIVNPMRSIATGFLTPVLFSARTGHFVSSFKMMAVAKNGTPLPWYTYPSIDFLKYRSYSEKTVLEFGGGQSTLWWASRAKNVVTLEGDKQWYQSIKNRMPSNVDLNYVSMKDPKSNTDDVRRVLAAKPSKSYDVIIIDGLYRFEMIEIALQFLAEDGIIICDNAEGYGFYEGFANSDLNRVDFFGHAPGVILPQATSIFFRPGSPVFSARYPIPPIAREM